MMLTFLDRAIGYVSPTWGKRRAFSRLGMASADEQISALRSLDAAGKGRLQKDWPTDPQSADQQTIDDLSSTNARARRAVFNDWAASSLVKAYVRHVVGKGLSAKSTGKDPITNTPLTDWNRQATRYFDRWARDPRRCDVERRRTFRMLQRLWVRELVTVGETFIRIVRRAGKDVSLQTLEPEQLYTDLAYSPDGGAIKGGIEVDEFGAPVAYWFYPKNHPLEGGVGVRRSTGAGDDPTSPVRIPEDEVIHLYDPERVRQARGLSFMASVLVKLWHLSAYDQYQLVKARIEACVGATIETDPRYDNGQNLTGLPVPSGQSSTDVNGARQLFTEPGMMWEAPAGKRVNWMPPVNPGNNYQPFTRKQVADFAAGAGKDLPQVTRDFSGNTYSGQRQGMLEDEKETDALQQIITDLACRPIRRDVLTQAVLNTETDSSEHRLDAPEHWNDGDEEWTEAYLCDEWRGPPKGWIDPRNEADATKTLLDTFQTTLRDELNEQDGDWEDKIIQRGEELKLIRKSTPTEQPSVTPEGEPVGVEDNATADTESE
jgi:lambda family phage portal protein